MAPARIDRVTTVARRLSAIDWTALEKAFRGLERDARKVIAATLTGPARVTAERAGDLRFVGQGFELVTPLPAGPYSASSAGALRKAFLAEYQRIFGRVPPVGEIEIVNIRVAVSAPVGRGALKVTGGRGSAAAIKGRRKAWLSSRGAFARMPVYDRYALAIGARVKGPAIIEEASATAIVPSRAVATVDRSGNLNIVMSP
jgi:N-methylhydantoinase A